MTKTKIELILEDWNYNCGDGCCSDWGTSLACENLETGEYKQITDDTLSYDTATMLVAILETIFPNLTINFHTIWIPELNEKQINEFILQFSQYNSTFSQGEEVIYPLSTILFENTINITEYVIQTTNKYQNYIALVLESEYVYSSEISNIEERNELDAVVDILKYLDIEVTVTEDEKEW